MIAIPNMEKPKECGGCQFNVNQMGGSYEWQECVLLNEDITHFDIARDDCPLIEIDLVRCGECKHRDPEDKKCDCGMFERQGCIFPVDDDYFCKYGERRADDKTEESRP